MDSKVENNSFIVEGGHKINGKIRLRGFKNNSIKLIPASILVNGIVQLNDVPDLLDVQMALKIFEELGGKFEFNPKEGKCTLDSRGINSYEIDPDLSKRFRASVSFLGPLFAKFQKAIATYPGGDQIGVRDIDTHFQVFKSLGAVVQDLGEGRFLIEGDMKAERFMLEQPSVTATENAIMASVLGHGSIEIYNAACECHVQDLCNFLNTCGAKISGIGSNLLKIERVQELKSCAYTLCSDPIDAGIYTIAACITNGSIEIENVNLDDFLPILIQFKKLGVTIETENNKIFVKDNQSLKINNSYWGGIYSQPWPLFPSDIMSPTITLATQCEGHIMFFEKLYEGRMNFVSQLITMGADIFVADPHRVIVNGKTKLYGSQVSSLDVRAGVAVLMAALCAEGKSEIVGIKHIDRGYDHIDVILNNLGANIQRF